MRAPKTAGQPAIDGRAARSARTRDAVVRALLALIAEGDLRPTAGRIAERAGISLRSVYVHFDDLDDLFNAAAGEQRSRVVALTRVLPNTGEFDGRLCAFVDQRARVLEAIAGVARAAAVQEPFSPALAATTKTARQLGRAELQRVFATELDRFDPVVRDHALDACDALTNSGSWAFLRMHRELDAKAAADTLATSLCMLLNPEVNPAPARHARRWRTRPSAKPADRGGEERR